MKLTITHLKAPWPAGAAIGDVIELPSVPPWALGKCAPAAEDAAATVVFGAQADAPADKPDAKAKAKG